MAIGDIIDFWVKNVPFNIKERIDKLKDTCCPSLLKVLDFDTAKDNFLSLISFPESIKPCSVDAVIYMKKKQAICFLEMKAKNNEKEFDRIKFVEQQIKECIPKFNDTVYLLFSILGYYQISKSKYADMLHPKRLKIVPYIVFNLHETDLAPIRTILVNELNVKLSSRLQTPINLVTCQDIDILFS